MDTAAFRRALLAWYDREKRELPWRGTREPYRVWLSEIMLQQTRAEAVAPRYAAFLARFPTVEALAAADEEAVLKAWEGMGYYSRARNLRRAAQEVVRRGGFPQSAKELQGVAGRGRVHGGGGGLHRLWRGRAGAGRQPGARAFAAAGL